MLRNLLNRLAKPHELVGPAQDPLMRRWFLFPKNRWFGIYLHHIRCSDEDRALHDHPKPNISIVLRGSYREWMFLQDAPRRRETWDGVKLFAWDGLAVDESGRITAALIRRAGQIVWRRASLAHRIELIDDKPCWTLFITGPKHRQWGFHCVRGWVPHYVFHDRNGCG
jgi:hypothetical protein